MTHPEQNGQTTAAVLRWTGKLLSADDLRRHLNGARELIVQRQAIVTPLAVDELRKQGVRLLRGEPEISAPTRSVSEGPAKAKKAVKTGYAQERPSPLVASALQSLTRDGVALTPMQDCDGCCGSWARNLSECVSRGDCSSCVIFCADPGLICCVANKIAGLRAVAVQTAVQAVRAQKSLAANVLAVEMPGRTYFEIRQIILTLCRAGGCCPETIASTLSELDGHAHR